MQKADLVIIVGTSFVVYPFAQLLAYRKEDSKVWAVNKTAIPASGVNSIIDDAINVFEKL